MTAMTTPALKDFSKPRKRITFRIDDDVFEAAPAIPGDLLTQFASRYADIGTTSVADQLTVMKDALSLVLLPESQTRFNMRLSSLENPIELEQAADVIQWLMGEYGMRPTQPSSPSADGLPSQESGMSSTDVPLPPESIPEPFQLTAG